LTAFIDARSLPEGTVLTPDLAIIGAGPAGISLALALADTPYSVILLESGGMEFEAKIQALYKGAETGDPYVPLDLCRLRYMGGSSNHWGGYCRPLDAIDFEARSWVPHSGWPFGIDALRPYFARAQSLVEAGSWNYDTTEQHLGSSDGKALPLGRGGVYTSWFQFSNTRDDMHPTYFGHRYGADLKGARRVTTYLHASVTSLKLSDDAARIEALQVIAPDQAGAPGRHFQVKPRFTVIAGGAIENARLLLASNDVMKTGVGNQNDLVGRFFADHPIPRDVATLVLFAGAVPAFYFSTHDPINSTFPLADGTLVRAAFSPSAAYAKAENVVGSLTTVEGPVGLDAAATAAVVTTAQALNVDASQAHAYTLGCGMELMPDPERRLTLTGECDALGMPRLNLNVRISDADFALYRKTLEELGRQLLAAKTGMLRLNYHSREGWMEGMTKQNQVGWGNHHLGTTRMSADAKTGVVDADSKVHGVANLYVAGSSVFPTYGSSNPTLNLVALTLRLADHLKQAMA
jgi:choline dehydrogenase-like flavoprotein